MPGILYQVYYISRRHSTIQTILGYNPFRTAVPFWEQFIQSPISLCPKRDCGAKSRRHSFRKQNSPPPKKKVLYIPYRIPGTWYQYTPLIVHPFGALCEHYSTGTLPQETVLSGPGLKILSPSKQGVCFGTKTRLSFFIVVRAKSREPNRTIYGGP